MSNEQEAESSMNQMMLDNETMYLNMHTIVFPDTKHSMERVDELAKKHNALAKYNVQALMNVIFPTKLDAMAFYHELNG